MKPPLPAAGTSDVYAESLLKSLEVEGGYACKGCAFKCKDRADIIAHVKGHMLDFLKGKRIIEKVVK